MLSDISTIEKLDSKLVVLEKSFVNIYDLVEECVTMFNLNAREKDVSLECSWDRSNNVELIEMDPNKIAIVLRNLISNAIKFSQVGGKVRIRIRTMVWMCFKSLFLNFYDL